MLRFNTKTEWSTSKSIRDSGSITEMARIGRFEATGCVSIALKAGWSSSELVSAKILIVPSEKPATTLSSQTSILSILFLLEIWKTFATLKGS